MKVPLHLLLALFTISAAVGASVIPEEGKYPSFVTSSSHKLTTAPITGDEYQGTSNLAGGYR